MVLEENSFVGIVWSLGEIDLIYFENNLILINALIKA